MKYVVLYVLDHDKAHRELNAREIPIVFPNELVHADVYHAVAEVLMKQSEKGTFRAVTAVSAGDINSMDLGKKGLCHGQSETLKLRSRGVVDDTLIGCYDYLHGIVS